VVVIGGDGIGPEVISSTMRVMEALSPDLDSSYADMGQGSYETNGAYLPAETLRMLEEADACLFGAVTSSTDPALESPLLFLRRHLDLYVNVRPVRRLAPNLGLVDLDLIIFRENTEGMYTREERREGDSIILERRVTEGVCRRLVRFARNQCLKEGRRKLTCVHKANVLRNSDGMFRRVFMEEMEDSGLDVAEMLVDAAAAALISRPEEMDCLVTLNLYGDILSDEAAALVGGIGLAPSANIGDRMAIFEPIHGSAPDIQGKDIANPVGAMLSGSLMLRYLGMPEEASAIEEAVRLTLLEGERTRDAGGSCGTRAFTDQVIARLPRT
jgi:methanogen homoisocitrate dehydrogenase